MGKGTKLAACTAAFALCSVVAACASDDGDEADTTEQVPAGDTTPVATDAPAASEPPPADDVELDPDAVIRIIDTAPPPGTWDPATTTGVHAQNVQFYTYVYDSLLYLNADGELEPALATEWEYDDARTVLTLTLRDDVTFTDGAEFTADVAKENLDRVRNGSGRAAPLLAGIEEIEVVSPTELVITQTGPNVKVLFGLASMAAAMVSPLALENPDSLTQTPVGSGPYTLERADTSSATFVRNDDYWNTDVQYAAGFEVIGATDPNARINAMLTDQADVLGLGQGVPTPDLAALIDDGTFQSVTISAQPNAIGINNTLPPFDNPAVIDAINMAIDREQYNEIIYEGTCAPTSQVFFEGQAGYIDGLTYEYDPDGARQILEDEGLTNLTMVYQATAGTSSAPTELVQSMLGEIGITVEVVQAPVQEVFANFFNGQVASSTLLLFLDMPDSSFVTDYLVAGQNPGEKPSELVDLVDEANALAADDPARAEAYEAINEYVFENPVMVPICQRQNTFIAKSDIVGLDSLPFANVGTKNYTRLGVSLG